MAQRGIVQRISKGSAVALCAAALGGCYYHVYDAHTGKSYYTDEWVAADGYRGPLTIRDEGGRSIRLPDARVARIGKDEYIEATSAEQQPPE